MVPFWVPIIIRHLLFRVPKQRDHNFDNHPYKTADMKSYLVSGEPGEAPTLRPGFDFRFLKGFLRDPNIPQLRDVPQIIGASMSWFKVDLWDHKFRVGIGFGLSV